MFGEATEPGQFTFGLLAVDGRGAKVKYWTMAFAVIRPPRFKPVAATGAQPEADCHNSEDFATIVSIVVDRSYTLCVPPIDAFATDFTGGGVADAPLQIRVDLTIVFWTSLYRMI